MLEYWVPDQITDNFENNYLGLTAPVNQIGNHAKPSLLLVHLNFHLKYDWALNCPIANYLITNYPITGFWYKIQRFMTNQI